MKINSCNQIFAMNPLLFKGNSDERNSKRQNDNFTRRETCNLTPEKYIQERLSSLKNNNCANVVPPVAICMMLRECADTEGLRTFIQNLRTDVLNNINWTRFASEVIDNQPEYERYLKNAAFLNSLSARTLAKFEDPTYILFSDSMHFESLGEILSNLNINSDNNVKTIHTKSELLPNSETKNVFRFCDKDDNLLAKETILFDSQGEVLLKEHEKIIKGPDGKQSIREIEDLRFQKSHLVNSNISDVSIKTIIPNYELCVEKDENDNIHRILYRCQSKVEGVFNVFEIIPGSDPGNVAVATRSGDEIHLRKQLESYEGVSTLYSLDAKDDGSRSLSYIITGKNGDVLLNKKSQVTKIDDDTYTTNVNGRCFIARYANNSITVNDIDSGRSHKFDLQNFIKKDEDRIARFLITLEAPEIIRLFKNSTAFIESSWNRSHYNYGESYDIMCDLSIFDLCHELGHATDYNNGIIGNIFTQLSSREEFSKVFKEEAEIFMKNSTVTQRDYLRHLVGTKPRVDYAKESFAEANAILNYIQQHHDASSRAECFQQYFPKTIACTYKILNE